MAWSKDGDKLASGAADGSIKIWFMDKIASSIASSSRISGNVSIELTNGSHSRNVNQVQWSPLNQNVLASCSNDKSVKIWNISSGEHLNILTEVENLILCWHPTKPILVVGTKDDRILFYEFNDIATSSSSPNLIETLKFSCEVNEISWSSDGNDLAVALGNGNCDIFRVYGKVEKIKSLKAHTADCFTVRFKGSNLLALGSSDAQITLWRNYTCFRVLNRMEWPIRTVDFSHDGEFLAVGSEDPFIAVEHLNSNSLVAKIPTTSNKSSGVPVNSVTWHPNKHILAFATSEVDDRTGKATGTIKLFGLG